MLRQAQCQNAMRNLHCLGKKRIQCTSCIFNTGFATEQRGGVLLDTTWWGLVFDILYFRKKLHELKAKRPRSSLIRE